MQRRKIGQRKSNERSKTETKSRGHNREEELSTIVVSSGKSNRQVGKNKDWKWGTRSSNFFFPRENTFVFRAEVDVEARFLNICLILFQVQIHIFLLYLEYIFKKWNKIFLNILWEFLVTIFEKWLARYYYYRGHVNHRYVYIFYSGQVKSC